MPWSVLMFLSLEILDDIFTWGTAFSFGNSTHKIHNLFIYINSPYFATMGKVFQENFEHIVEVIQFMLYSDVLRTIIESE